MPHHSYRPYRYRNRRYGRYDNGLTGVVVQLIALLLVIGLPILSIITN